jgi:hypothetical protein
MEKGGGRIEGNWLAGDSHFEPRAERKRARGLVGVDRGLEWLAAVATSRLH